MPLIMPPKDMLPTDSQRWGRWVTDAVQKTASAQESAANDSRQRASTTAATISRLRTQISDLQRTNDQLQQTADQLVKTSSDLVTTTNFLNSLTTTGVSTTGSWNSGDIPGDQTVRWSDGGMNAKLTTNVATGRVLVGFGAGQITVNAGNSGAIAYLRIVLTTPSGFRQELGTGTRVFASGGSFLGVPAYGERTVNVPNNEPVTISVEFGTWSSSTNPLGNAQFGTPFVRATVVPA